MTNDAKAAAEKPCADHEPIKKQPVFSRAFGAAFRTETAVKKDAAE